MNNNQYTCSTCGLSEKLKTCGHCRKELYCSPECQRIAWPAHYKKCNVDVTINPLIKFYQGFSEIVCTSTEEEFEGYFLRIDKFETFELHKKWRNKTENDDQTLKGTIQIKKPNTLVIPQDPLQYTIDFIKSLYSQIEVEFICRSTEAKGNIQHIESRFFAQFGLKEQTLAGKIGCQLTSFGKDLKLSGENDAVCDVFAKINREKEFNLTNITGECYEEIESSLQLENITNISRKFLIFLEKVTSLVPILTNRLDCYLELGNIWCKECSTLSDPIYKFPEMLETILLKLVQILEKFQSEQSLRPETLDKIRPNFENWMLVADQRVHFIASVAKMKSYWGVVDPAEAQKNNNNNMVPNNFENTQKTQLLPNMIGRNREHQQQNMPTNVPNLSQYVKSSPQTLGPISHKGDVSPLRPQDARPTGIGNDIDRMRPLEK